MSHTLFVSVEKVPPTNSGATLLGVSLTVLPDSPPLNSELARPWKWKNLNWLVWGSPDGTTWTPIAAAQIRQVPVPATDKPAPPDPWSKILEMAIEQITKWPLGTPTPTTKIALKDDGTTPGEHQYLSLLNNMAAGPYPVPQNLNLSLFLELTGIPANFTQFLAAPSFSADGATIQPAANVTIPASDSMWDVTGSTTMKMLTWFSDPEKDFPSLWVKPPVRNGNATLVSDWTAHLYELIGPCLDLPHVILNMDKSKLKASLPDNSQDWPGFRRWMIAGLYDLVVSRLPVVGAVPSMDTWVDVLKTTLKDSLTDFPDLTPEAPLPQSFDVGIAELMKIVSTATAGKKLIALMKAFYGKQLQGIPRSLLRDDDNGALSRWLEVGLALPHAKQIADACAKSPENYDAISKAVGQAVIYPSLVQVPTLLAGTTMPPAFQSIANACVADLQKDLMKALSLRANGDDGSSWPATSSAPPLVIPVMQLKSNDGLPTDPLHGIRGVGVLMRRQAVPEMDWKCPNIVAAVGDPRRPLLVASRLGYNQRLLTGFLPYDNGPIPCENLLHNYLPKADQLGSGEQSPINPVFQYTPYEGTDLSLYGTPTLECGELFEVVCFAVSNAGALPVELRDDYPAKFKALANGVPLPGEIKAQGETKAQPSPLLQIIRYFRTVPVGSIETRDAKGMQVVDSAGVFPRNSANVWPRSIETVVPKIGVKLQMAGGDLTPAKPSTLLVVPVESNNKRRAYGTAQHFEFSFNLPLIEPLTWDRTVGYKKDSILRAQILDAAYSSLALKKPADITDPLITHVDVSLYRWDMISGSGKWTSLPGTVTFPVDALRKAATGVNSVQTSPIRISIDAGSGKDDGSVKLAVISGSGSSSVQDLAASLAESEVYLLEVTFRLDSSVSTIMQGYPQTVTGFQLLIEIASAKMPSPADLNATFSISAKDVNNIPDQKVIVELNTDSSPVWRNVHSADFLRQSWHWTGRTQPEPLNPQGDLKKAFDNDLLPGYFPASGSLQSKAVQDWAMVEFGERPWTDHIVLPTTLKSKVFRWEQDMSLDPRAAYLRFAPRVYSRYQGAFEGLAPQGVTTVGNGGDDVWQPFFLRSRTTKLEMPRLKALIPLTESAFTPGTPGILAVFDGPAYEQAGLAERLQVFVAEVSDPDPKMPDKKWSQDGPDFLMGDPNPDKPMQLKLDAIGPIGHTLDSVYSSFPKFISHSWIIRPALVLDSSKSNSGADFSWWFANLEFQLSIDDKSSVFKDAKITSQKAFGSWIQFLPGFQDLTGKANHLDGWKLEWADNAITIYNQFGKTVRHTDQSGKNERHTRHYLLVTRTVLDVTGKLREAYLGMAAASGDKWMLFKETLKNIPKGVQLRARFLDVRTGEIGSTNKAPASDVEFWQRILGHNNQVRNDEDRASIIAVSPVIRQKGGLQ